MIRFEVDNCSAGGAIINFNLIQTMLLWFFSEVRLLMWDYKCKAVKNVIFKLHWNCFMYHISMLIIH